MSAQLEWWTNVDGYRACGPTVTSSNWTKVQCNFTPAQNTTQSNIHMWSIGNYDFAYLDDVQLFIVSDGGGNDHLNVNLRHDTTELRAARDYRTSIMVAALPGGYTCNNCLITDWLAVYTPRFFQVGFQASASGMWWFVETVDIGQGHLTLQCLQETSGKNGQYCAGSPGSIATVGRWQDVELVAYPGDGFWIARVYDQYGNPTDVAKVLNESSLTIKSFPIRE